MDILKDLNVNQKKAVESEGCVIVVAGPGTGKTKTLTSRIAYLIQQKNVPPEEILALTFTQKASAEMKERLKHLTLLPYISTFHALAFDILKNINESIEIISEKERREILEIIQQRRIDKKLKSNVKDISLLITRFKNELQKQDIPLVVEEYNQLLGERGLLDYDDLLLHLYQSLLKNDEKIFQFKNRFSHILVDEFQDTNNLQYQIIKLLLKNNNLFVIGDPYQSIYSFRGANPEIFTILQHDFPSNTFVSLDSNYRSVEKIIQASSHLFQENIPIRPVSTKNGKAVLVKTINEYTEAEWIVGMIQNKIGGTDLIQAGNFQNEKREVCFADFAVIYRTHHIGRLLEQTFIDSGIPYQIIGGASVYEQPEVAFIITLLQFSVHKNYEYFKELLSSPVLRLSSKSRRSLSKLFHEKNKIFLDFETSTHLQNKRDIQIVSTIADFIKNIDGELKSNNLVTLIHKIMNILFFKEYMAKDQHIEKNIHTFMSTITQFQGKPDSVKKCLEYFEFLKEHEFYDPTCDKVTLLTMHASKGLEFKYVFICGFEDGIIPLDSKDIDIEEEKRLLYVGMTRAKEGLYLSYTQQRNKKQSIISQFYSRMNNYLDNVEDRAIKQKAQQIKKWKEKKSQLQLF